MHGYAVQNTVADVRDGPYSGSTPKEASSWGKVETREEEMVYAEATSVLPLIVNHLYHTTAWTERPRRDWSTLFDGELIKIQERDLE